jgi:hypothetical protein
VFSEEKYSQRTCDQETTVKDYHEIDRIWIPLNLSRLNPASIAHTITGSLFWAADRRAKSARNALFSIPAKAVEQESTRTVMTALCKVIEQKGLFCALSSNRASHFFLTPKTRQPVDYNRVT